jgi:hypothetical protein
MENAPFENRVDGIEILLPQDYQFDASPPDSVQFFPRSDWKFFEKSFHGLLFPGCPEFSSGAKSRIPDRYEKGIEELWSFCGDWVPPERAG